MRACLFYGIVIPPRRIDACLVWLELGPANSQEHGTAGVDDFISIRNTNVSSYLLLKSTRLIQDPTERSEDQWPRARERLAPLSLGFPAGSAPRPQGLVSLADKRAKCKV